MGGLLAGRWFLCTISINSRRERKLLQKMSWDTKFKYRLKASNQSLIWLDNSGTFLYRTQFSLIVTFRTLGNLNLYIHVSYLPSPCLSSAVGQSVPVSVAREVSAEGACSLSVVVVRTAKDVEAALRRNRGEGLSVALLDTPQQAAVFVQVCGGRAWRGQEIWTWA